MNFTGSVPAGRSIEHAAAGTFTGVGLELGGKDPAYVRRDADLANAVENIVDGVAELVARYELGDPLDPATTLGPMVKDRAADAVR